MNMKNYEKLLNNYHTHDIGAACRLVAGVLAYHACGYNCHISALDYIFFFQKLNRGLNQKVCGVCASCLERLYVGPVAETGFFLTYLMMFAILAAVFGESAGAAAQVLERQIQFMKVLLPSYFTAVVWSGAGFSSAAWYEAALFLIAGVQKLYAGLLLSLVRIYFLAVLAGSMVKEDMFSRMTELLRSGISWGSRSLIGIVLGFQLIQGMVLPYADSVKNAGMQRLLQAIPGIGDGAGAVTKLMMGSGVLIKNTMGAAAVLLLFVLSILPLARILVLYLLYRGVAAVLQPVADNRLTACLSGAAQAQAMLLRVAASGFLLFAVTIALICQGTNAAYLSS